MSGKPYYSTPEVSVYKEAVQPNDYSFVWDLYITELTAGIVVVEVHYIGIRPKMLPGRRPRDRIQYRYEAVLLHLHISKKGSIFILPYYILLIKTENGK